MMTQGMKIAVSGIALVMAITVCEPVEAQVSQMMRPSELGGSGRTGVSQQRVPTTAQQVMNKKPETNKSVSDSGSGSSAASVNSANQNGSSGILDTTKGSGGVLDLNQTTNNPLLDNLKAQGNDIQPQGSSGVLDLTKGSGGVLDTTKGSGGVLDLNQTTHNPLLDKSQEQGNAGTTQSGTNAGQSGSGTGTAGSAPSSTGVGPTKEAAGSSFDNPFAAFDKSQENTSGQNSGTGIGDSYFGSNPLKEMENDTSDAAVAYRNKVSEVETAQKELEAAIKSGDKAQIKASEEKLNNLSKQAQESAVSYAQKNSDAIQNANAYELRKDGWETDEKGNILASEKNFEKYRAESGSDAMDMEGFKNLTKEINAYGDNSGQAMQDRIDVNKALEAVSSENMWTGLEAGIMVKVALKDAATPGYNADGTLSKKFDPNNLNDQQRAILDRVDSWKKQNEKRKAAGQDPVSFNDYVHRGGLSQDVVIYKEAKLPSMAGQWHQAVDNDYGESASQRLGDMGIVVKTGSGSGKRQVGCYSSNRKKPDEFHPVFILINFGICWFRYRFLGRLD